MTYPKYLNLKEKAAPGFEHWEVSIVPVREKIEIISLRNLLFHLYSLTLQLRFTNLNKKYSRVL